MSSIKVAATNGNTSSREKKGVDLTLLVSQAIEKNDASSVYGLASQLARVSTAEYAGYKTQLKAHFKGRLSTSDLDQAVKEARKNRKLASLATYEPGDNSRPVVETGGQLRDVVQAALNALVHADKEVPTIFVRESELVAIHYTKVGSPTITPLSESGLRHRMSLSADYVCIRTTNDDIKVIPVDPPLDVVRVILDGLNPADYPFPSLLGITELPILRPDGSIHDVPGYDPVTQYMYIPGDLIVPSIPDIPTEEQVLAACQLLDYLFTDFPFADNASRATIIADLITVVIRSVINGQVPLTLVDAPKQGTGKTLLAQIVGAIATGRIVPTNAPTGDEEEWRKKILTWLLPSPSVVIIDNVIHRLESSSLNSILTSPYGEDRELGSQKLIRVTNRAVWFATGNNIRVGDDTARRCIKCSLDAGVEKPWKRKREEFTIKDNILDWAVTHRGELVAAILTLTRNWYTQGQPKPSVTPLGSFEDWTIIVGGILQSAHILDFLANLEGDEGEVIDEISAEWKTFVVTLFKGYKDTPFTTQELAKLMLDDTDIAQELRENLPGSLTKNLDVYQKSQGKNQEFPTHIGYALRTKKSTVYGDLRLQSAGKDRTNKALWQVVSLTPKTPVEPTPKTDALLSSQCGLCGTANWRLNELGKNECVTCHSKKAETATPVTPTKSMPDYYCYQCEIRDVKGSAWQWDKGIHNWVCTNLQQHGRQVVLTEAAVNSFGAKR